ncbi:hypothetical protein YC2023_060959 [Brassica napus]|uniref:tRNAHis guanylyltransferase catalytic domain-containing protein n=2 Tax=Brassica TaxID=3705 RepID=A0A3P6F698_BRAOL|nr:unnamed protein product [Brassica napus]VDD45206.1 unnamed protein product [Brassica oleracea]
MAKSKSKKKGKLNSQPSSPHIDIGDFVDGRDDEQIRAPVWRGRCDGEQVRAPLWRGRRDSEQVRAPVWRGRDDKLNFDIYRFKYQFLSSYQNVNGDGPYILLRKDMRNSGEIDCALNGFGNAFFPPSYLFNHYRFSLVHEFEKPNDETSLNLMNSCPAAVLEKYPNIIFAYGYSHFHSCFNVLQELDHMQVKDLKTTIYLITPTSPELDVTKPQDMVRPGSLSLLAEAYDRCIQRKHTYEMRASSSTHVSTLGSF